MIAILGLFLNAAFADRDVTAAYTKMYDFAQALTPRTRFLGYRGPQFKRLRVTFSSVKRSQSSRSTYEIRGSTKSNDQRCHFSGTLSITKISSYATLKSGIDDSMKGEVQAEGELQGHYVLTEETANPHCHGVFQGTATLYWYVNRKGQLLRDSIDEEYSDNYKNNQYEGTWIQSHSGKAKPANWGEYRIPQSNDLDTGAGDFSPNPKYESWRGYQKGD